MLKKIARYLISAQKIRTAFISSTFINLISKLVGYVRMAVIAYAFGLTVQMDSYNVASSLMEITVFILGNSFEVLGIPQLVKTLKDKGESYFNKLSGSLFSLAIFATFVLIIVTYVSSVPLLNILAPGFSPEKKKLTLGLLPYFLPVALTYIPYYALSAVLKSVKRFRIVVLSDLFVTLVSLFAIICYYKNGFEIIPLSLGVAYTIGLFLEIICVFRLKIIKLTLDIFSPEMKVIYNNILNLSILFIISQLYRVVDKGFGSLLPTGNISALSYALIITSTLVTMFSFSGIYLTGFSETKDHNNFFKKATAMNIFISVPIMVFFVFNSVDFLRLVLKRGLFDENAAIFTGGLLSIYTLILFASLTLGLVYSFYQSQNKFKIVIILSGFGLGLNALLNFVFVRPLGASGIVMATVISSYIVLFVTVILLYKTHLEKGLFGFMFKNLFLLTIICIPLSALTQMFIFNVIVRSIIYFSLVFCIFTYFDIPRSLEIKSMAVGCINKFLNIR